MPVPVGDTASRVSDLAGTLAVALAFLGIGSLVERATDRRAGKPIGDSAYMLLHGWSAAVLVALAMAVIDARLAIPMLSVAGLGVLAYGFGAARGALVPLLTAWLLLAPLLVIAAGSPAAMYDEFAHWLPNARFLIEHGVFPSSTLPNVWTGKPEYPPGLAAISYLAHLISGADIEETPKVYVVLLSAGFGLVLADLFRNRIGRLAAIGVGVTLASVANPFFDPRIALTSYADAPTGFVLGIALAACWRGLQSGETIWRWRAGSAALILVFLRETNIIFVLALGAALALQGRQGRRIAPAVLVPGLLAFLSWRVHLWQIGLQSTITARPIGAWDWTAPWTVLRVLLVDRLGNNPGLGMAAVAFAVVALAATVWVVRHAKPDLRALLGLLAVVSLGWMGFLAWSYTAVFTAQEVANAGSAWRYLSQLGPALIFVIAAVGAGLWPDRYRMDRIASWATAAACALPVAIVLLTPRHWRAECQFPDVIAVRGIAEQLRERGLGESELSVVHPVDAAWFAVAIDYDLHRPHGRSIGVSAREAAGESRDILDLSALDRTAMALGGDIPEVTLERQAAGQPRQSFTIRATSSRPCGA